MCGSILGRDTHETIARELFAAHRDAEPIAPLRGRFDLSVADGYAVSRRVTEHRLERGEEGDRVGYKIGFTSDATRTDLAIDEPAFGQLLGGTVSEITTDATIDSRTFIAPRIEPEIAFVLAEPVSEPLGRQTALSAVEAIVPAIEVVDCRIRDWNVTAPEAVADNALAAALYTGERRDASETPLDLAHEGVTVEIDGETVATGRGEDVLGHPAEALAWLTETFAGRKERLEAGDIVSTGSITRPIDVRSGQEVTVRFDALGTVRVRIE